MSAMISTTQVYVLLKKDESVETERQKYTEETTTNCSNNENIILLETS